MPQTSKKLRLWIGISIVWFLLSTVVAVYLANHSKNDLASYFDTVGFNTILITLHLPLIIGWGLWWKAPSLLTRVDDFFTGSRIEDESKDRLSKMLNDGLHLLNRPVTTELEFNRWKTDENNWVGAVYRELKTGFNESLAESFQSVDGVQEYDIVSSFNSEHNTRKLFLNKRLNNLVNIIK